MLRRILPYMLATSIWDSNPGTLALDLVCSAPKIILPGAEAGTFELSFQRTDSQRVGSSSLVLVQSMESHV